MNSIVSIIILNWNGWQDTIECIESLNQINYPYYNVIILDNNSKDNSIKKIKEYCRGKLQIKSKFFKYNPKNKPIKILEYYENELLTLNEITEKFQYLPPNRKLILIKNDKNYGFAEGNNIGIRFALKVLNTDYILLLNNDTVVDKNFLNELVKNAEIDFKIGLLGPKIYYYDFNGKNDVINFAGGNLNLWKGTSKHIGKDEFDHNQYDQIKFIDFVDGSCFLVKKRLLEKIGFLNPNYFTYWEENDLCMRGFRAGYSCLYVPNSRIWHKISKSTKKIDGFYEYFMIRNTFWFMKKFANNKQLIIFYFYFFGFKLFYRIFIYSFYFRNFRKLNSFLNGVIDGVTRNIE